MSRLLFIIILHLCFISGISAQKLIDSLKSLLPSSEEGKKIEILNKISVELKKTDPNASLDYATQALTLAKKIKDLIGESEAYYNIGVANYYLNNLDAAQENYEKSLVLKEKLNDSIYIAKLLYNIGMILHSRGSLDKALEYYQKSSQIEEKLKNLANMARVNNAIGIINMDLRNQDRAKDYFELALEQYKRIGDKAGMGDALMNIGVNYFKSIITSREEEESEDSIFDNTIIKEREEVYNNAIKYYELALVKYQEMNIQYKISLVLNNISSVYKGKKDNKKAIEYAEKSIVISEKIGDVRTLALGYGTLGVLYLKNNDYKKALEYTDKSMSVASKANLLKDIELEAYKSYAEIYSKIGLFDKALKYHRRYSHIKDSIYSKETQSQFAEMQTKYETTKKEQEIVLLNKDKALQDSQIKRQQIMIYTFIIGFLVIIIFSTLLYKQYSEKKKANKALALKNEEILKQKEKIEAQHDLIAEQKHAIMDSIHYARRIQTAILPLEDDINDVLCDNFILYKPRDIVSGDFYWFTRKDGNTVITVADCTGHGVPGAFMSMLGVSFLNEIVNKRNPSYPSQEISPEAIINLKANEILNQLREAIIKALHQTGKTGESKDGMDIALCIINHQTNEMQYAGANNPLYLITPDPQGHINKGNRHSITSGTEQSDLAGQLIEIKADKMPIGIYYSQELATFTNKIIQLEKGNCIYIFSDGYADQVGGPHGKKFKYQPLKNLLVDNSNKSMKEQAKILDDTIESWKKFRDPHTGEAYEQVDDILMIGFRI
ncbi:MAG: tetratricopeptide repeat protein [Bacteroidia bacterium]|nr:tetratricopeptide repeat protein [Bacteroidia bacterium]